MRGKYFGYNSKAIIEDRPKILGPLPTCNQLYPGLLDLKMLISCHQNHYVIQNLKIFS